MLPSVMSLLHDPGGTIMTNTKDCEDKKELFSSAIQDEGSMCDLTNDHSIVSGPWLSALAPAKTYLCETNCGARVARDLFQGQEEGLKNSSEAEEEEANTELESSPDQVLTAHCPVPLS